ncbi:MAG: hypothetical protein JNJ55_02310 [Betaproteobacteria bacterium]|nr:hypothetical protein [Betaproteobacteria bacterium]
MILLAIGLGATTFRIVDRGPAYFPVCAWIALAILSVGLASFSRSAADRPPQPQVTVISKPGREPAKLSANARMPISPQALELHRQQAEGFRTLATLAWGAFALSIALGIVGGHAARRSRVRKGLSTPVKVADIEGFVGMLMAACDDKGIKSALDQLLELPDARRKEALRILIDNLRDKRAPSHLVDAFICLQDDAVAEKAYAAIYQCWNKPGFGPAKLA